MEGSEPRTQPEEEGLDTLWEDESDHMLSLQTWTPSRCLKLAVMDGIKDIRMNFILQPKRVLFMSSICKPSRAVCATPSHYY